MPAVEAPWLDVSGEFFPWSLGLLNVHLEQWTKDPGMSLRSKTVLEFRPFCSMIHWTQSMGLCCELHRNTSTNRTQTSDKVNAATKRASVLTSKTAHTNFCLWLTFDSHSACKQCLLYWNSRLLHNQSKGLPSASAGKLSQITGICLREQTNYKVSIWNTH